MVQRMKKSKHVRLWRSHLWWKIRHVIGISAWAENPKIKMVGLALFAALIVLSCAESPTRPQRGFAPKACLDCHGKKFDDLKKPYVHGPVLKK
ncbi:MAG: hypothetical protein Q7J61_00030, partial [Deltaproteobacteria bacterium]|nr:hypothetical protein [Deltaproteobacteria bacterium]